MWKRFTKNSIDWAASMSLRDNPLLRFLPLSVLIGLAVGWLMAGMPVAASAQTTDVRDFFPQMQETDWREFAEGRTGNREAFVENLFQRLENVPDSVWKQSVAANPVDLETAARSAADYAGSAFQVAGRIVRIANLNNPADAAPKSDDTIWSLLLETGDQSQVYVLVRDVPDCWPKSLPVDSVRGQGILLSTRRQVPVLVMNRLQWYPESTNPALQVDAGKVELARAGFDIASLQDVRQYSDAALASDEHQVFQDLLAAISRIDDNPIRDSGPVDAAPDIDLVELASHPDKHVGGIFRVFGQVRRITPVHVADPSMQQAIGGDRYYQLDVFIPLGDKQVVLGQENSITLTGSYGITVVLSELPAVLRDKRLPVQIEVPGFFLKNWFHRTLATRDVAPSMQRPNLIFVGLPGRMQLYEPRLAGGLIWLLIPAFWGGFVALLAGLFFWSRSRGPSWHERQRQQAAPELPGSPD